MNVGDRHLGWCHPSRKIHVVTVSWVSGNGLLTARADCGGMVTAVLEQTSVVDNGTGHRNLCDRCRRKAPELKVEAANA